MLTQAQLVGGYGGVRLIEPERMLKIAQHDLPLAGDVCACEAKGKIRITRRVSLRANGRKEGECR